MDAETALDRPLADLARLLRTGGVRAAELVRVALARAEASPLGGYRVVRRAAATAEAALADATLACGRDLGPLCGIPISVKDLYGMPGEDLYAGSPRALPPRFERAGRLLGDVLRQLAVVVGKTHTVELAFGGIGVNAHWGTPRNPRDHASHRVPGGSSSGAGTSLADGSAKVAFGTDTAGSVRIPAAWTGHVGVKTTKGRWPTDGIVPLSPTLDTPGFLVRTVDDAIYAFAALDGPVHAFPETLASIPERSPRELRLRFATGLFRDGTSPGVLEAVADALAELERRGARVEDAELPGAVDAKAVLDAGGPTAVELQRFLQAELPDWFDTLDRNVRDRLRSAAETPAGEYLLRLDRMRAASERAAAAFAGIDAVVTPTVAITPPRVADLTDLDAYRRANVAALRNTGVVSYLGLCAVSLPCGEDREGLPVGLQLVGPPGGDRALLGVARAVERALQREGALPPTSAACSG